MRHKPRDQRRGSARDQAQAEYAAVRAGDLAGKPRGLDHEHAAALASVGLTAWQALVDVAAVGSGQRVLIHAAAVIDYRVRDFTTAVRDLDVVFDLIGGDYGPRSLTVLRPGGLLVTSVLADPGNGAERARVAGTRFATVQVHPSGDDLEQLNRLVTGGRLRVHVDHVFPLADVAKAHELSESGRVRGKIALTVG